MSQIDVWLSEYVNSESFAKALEASIDALDKPADRVKVRLELMSYVVPKVKGIDALTADQELNEIIINYVLAKAPAVRGKRK